MTPPMEPRHRKQAVKVRSGCATCKKVRTNRCLGREEGLTLNKRHVKCDERRPPPCFRCEKSGLYCEYVESRVGERAKTPKKANDLRICAIQPARTCISDPAILHVPSCDDLKPHQKLYLEMYCHRVASQLPCPQFWLRTVLRESERDDSVRACLVALGALSQALSEKSRWRKSKSDQTNKCGNSSNNDNSGQAAVRHYTQSLAKFRTQLASEGLQMAPRNILIVTLLFAVFELMQGNIKSADTLMMNGILLLRSHLAIFNNNPSEFSRIANSIDDEGVREAEFLLPRMAATNSFGGEFGPPLNDFRYVLATQTAISSMAPPDNFSVKDIALSWDACITCSQMWVYRTALKAVQEEAGTRESFREMHQQLLVHEDAWLRLIRRKRLHETDGNQESILKIVQACIKLSCIIGKCYLDTTEMVWDQYTSECSAAVQLIESVTECLADHSAKLATLDDSIMAVIRAVARHCRVKHTRRRAMALARTYTPTEVNWAARMRIIGAEALIAVEEAGRDEKGRISADKRYRLTDCAWDDDKTKILITLTGTVLDGNRALAKRHVVVHPEDHGFS